MPQFYQGIDLDPVVARLDEEFRLCDRCRGWVTLRNELHGACSHCGAMLLSLVPPDRAAALFERERELKAAR